ncbi:MAG: UbiD family decarboxylase [Desulfobacterales bacterium]|nr:UbiD family decarboxylase [Desulfobacterales bacterium]
MSFDDNRKFIEALEKSGDVVRITEEVDWDLEVGAIVRRASERRDKAPFFEKIKDYPAGFTIFGEPLGTHRRLAVALGLSADTAYREIRQEYERRLATPILPVVVQDGPCKENVLQADAVDLFQFPAPMVHEGDGGRYIGTWHAVICNDPERKWTNWGMYRLMIGNKNHLTGLCEPYSHQYDIFNRVYAPKKQNLPVAIAIGMDPICSMLSGSRSLGRKNEVDIAGALRQKPVALVKCETNDLLVPAHSEIVFEGEMLQGETMIEGPFGEYTGYRSDPRGPRPVYRINAVTYRNNPVLTMSCMGLPVTSDTVVRSMDYEILIKRVLKMNGIRFTDVHVPLESATMMAIVSVKPTYRGVANQIGYAFAAAQMGAYKVIVVEDDVDVFNMTEVLHALSSKCHPIRGIRQYDEAIEPSSLNPFSSPEERKWHLGAKVIFDCTWPLDWEGAVPGRVSFNEMYPRDIRERVLQKWTQYGYD